MTTNFSVTRTIQFSFLQGIFNRTLALAKFQDFFEIVFLDFATASLVATKEGTDLASRVSNEKAVKFPVVGGINLFFGHALLLNLPRRQ